MASPAPAGLHTRARLERLDAELSHLDDQFAQGLMDATTYTQMRYAKATTHAILAQHLDALDPRHAHFGMSLLQQVRTNLERNAKERRQHNALKTDLTIAFSGDEAAQRAGLVVQAENLRYYFHLDKVVKGTSFGPLIAATLVEPLSENHSVYRTHQRADSAPVFAPRDGHVPIEERVSGLLVKQSDLAWCRVRRRMPAALTVTEEHVRNPTEEDLQRQEAQVLEDPWNEIAAEQILGAHPSILESCLFGLYTEQATAKQYLLNVVPWHRISLKTHLAGLDNYADHGRPTRRFLSRLDACRMMRQLSDALAFMHAQGIAHRDISTDNVVLTKDFDFVVIDFGLCAGRVLADDSSGAWRPMTKVQVGKPNYMAPELDDYRVKRYDPFPSDVYALGGVMLFSRLGAKAPFSSQFSLEPEFRYDRLETSEEQAFTLRLKSEILPAMLARDPAARPTAASLAAFPWA